MAKAKKVIAAPKAVKKVAKKSTKVTPKTKTSKKYKPFDTKNGKLVDSSLNVMCKIIDEYHLDVSVNITGIPEIIEIGLVESSKTDERLKNTILKSAALILRDEFEKFKEDKNSKTKKPTKTAKKTTKTKK